MTAPEPEQNRHADVRRRANVRRRAAVRRAEGDRLVYYYNTADAAFWDNLWLETITPAFYNDADRGMLDPRLGPLFLRHLPRAGRILEAGCGPGQYVAALRALGYDAEGVEWGERTVARVKTIKPDLPIRTGDVTALAVPDGHYAAYISLGVVEHRREGPEPFLAEASRVLAPDGVALISVPHFHALRRIKSRLGCYNGDPGGMGFYQYAFHPVEFGRILASSGFRVIETKGYDSATGVREELALVDALARGGAERAYNGLMRRLPGAENRLGHMMMYVCKKQ